MGLLFAFGAYIAYMIFTCRIVWRILVVWERTKRSGEHTQFTMSPVALLKATGDILLFPRLFSENPRVWIGEWIFHVSFSLVMVRHLRYVVDPVPGWVVALQQPGMWAGTILPFSLIYILAVKEIEKKKYVSGLNSALTGIVLLAGFTGLLSRCPVKGILPLTTLARPDIVGIKDYMIGLFSFAPGNLPEDGLFSVHFISALVLLAYLPTHIFAAPLSLLSSREREDAFRLLMHGEEMSLSGRRSSLTQDASAPARKAPDEGGKEEKGHA